jgi:integration host factor subunit beta
MVRSELLQRLCNLHPNVVRKDIKKILEIIFSEIADALSKGNSIEIRGFGTYKITTRKARIGRNPKNSELVKIPEKRQLNGKSVKIFLID